MSFLVRWGLALAAPRDAMAIADDPQAAGRAAGDLARAIGVVLVAAHTREVVAGVWIGLEVGPREAVPAFMRALSAASMPGLIFVIVAALVVTLGAGARRNLGRDFDLASVATLVPVTLTLAAALWARAVAPLGTYGRGLVLAVALGWGGVLVARAIAAARRRSAGQGAAA